MLKSDWLKNITFNQMNNLPPKLNWGGGGGGGDCSLGLKKITSDSMPNINLLLQNVQGSLKK